MTRVTRSIAFGSALIAMGCQSTPAGVAPLVLTCPQSLDAYCSQDPRCMRAIDPTEAHGSYCAQVQVGVLFGLYQCATQDAIVIDVDGPAAPVRYWFRMSNGELVAVLEAFSAADGGPGGCIAGPSTLTIVGEPCIYAPIAYGCGPDDASASDATSDSSE